MQFFHTTRWRTGDLSGYFGKKSDMFVHHLAEMKPECRIYPVKKEDKTYFTPDTLQNAKSKGFIPCQHCCRVITT